MLRLLNQNNNYRARVLIAGHKKELDAKRKFYKVLQQRNIRSFAKFNYLESDLENVEIDEEIASKSDAELNALFRNHDEKLFKRSSIAHQVVEPLFVQKNYKLVLFLT